MALERLLDLKINILEPQKISLYFDREYIDTADKGVSEIDSYHLFLEEAKKNKYSTKSISGFNPN